MKLHAVLACLMVLALAAACSSGSKSEGSTTADAGDIFPSDAPDPDTWDNWAAGFFATYCVECHAANNPDGLDFGQKSIVVKEATTIRCGVCVEQEASWSCPSNLPAEQFPISDSTHSNPKPSNAERTRAVEWIDVGCP
jgi:hypothetical protein